MPSNIHKRHHEMVGDNKRTPLIVKAIQQKIKKGDVIFEIGCGTGILTLEALKAGAGLVYACEIDQEADRAAKALIKKEGFEKKVVFFTGLSSDMELPRKIDGIIAETIGSIGLNENILPYVCDARKKWLKKNGFIIPQNLKIFLAPVSFSKKIPSNKNNEYDFMTGLVEPSQILAKEKLYGDISFLKNEYYGYDAEMDFTITRPGNLDGFCGWIEVAWDANNITHTSPFHPFTHWKQTLLPLAKSAPVKVGQKVAFRLIIGPKDEIFSTETLVEWGYKICI